LGARSKAAATSKPVWTRAHDAREDEQHQTLEVAMQSTMQDFPLTIGMIFRHGRSVYHDSEVVTGARLSPK
jgi:hypothetical protein